MSESTVNPAMMNETPQEQAPDLVPLQPDIVESEPVPKQVPVSEAIRYRKRAQAAEKELGELKQVHEKQNEEIEQLKQEVELLKTSSTPQASQKTQGVRESRTSGARSMLQTAARQAAGSGSRADVQEYLRLRRNFL